MNNIGKIDCLKYTILVLLKKILFFFNVDTENKQDEYLISDRLFTVL